MVIERIMLTHLIKEDEKIAGAAGFSLDEPKIHFFTAKSIILCTGAGGFKPNGFPICDLTHDGTVMAYDVGAKVTGKEWNDGHMASLKNPVSVFDQWGGMLQGPPSVTSIGIRHDLGVDLNYKLYRSGPSTKESSLTPARMESVSGGPYRPPGFDRLGPLPGHEAGKARGGEKHPPSRSRSG